jgi:maleylpyruvate isomerase
MQRCQDAAMTADSLPSGLAAEIRQVDEATGRLQAGLDSLAGAGHPSLCPGWTAGHVLTHLARNADGLRRSAEGARRGEEVPMYDSAQARDRDIEDGAGRPVPELIADLTRSAEALGETWSALRAADWERQMPHHRLGRLPLSDSPGMRLGEVLIHHVDLAVGYLPADWPAPFAADIIEGAGGGLAGRLPADVRLDLHVTDTGAALNAGSGARQVTMSGPSWAVAAWLAGRPGPALHALSVTGGELPPLTSWR